MLREDYILNKNCQNSNENLLENLKDKIENLLIEIENNDIDSNKLFDYRLTKNILSKNYTIDDYFNENEIHKYKEKYFLVTKNKKYHFLDIDTYKYI